MNYAPRLIILSDLRASATTSCFKNYYFNFMSLITLQNSISLILRLLMGEFSLKL